MHSGLRQGLVAVTLLWGSACGSGDAPDASAPARTPPTAPPPVAAPTLSRLSLAPKSMSLVAGDSQQFTVTGTWSDGSSNAPVVTFSATSGRIRTDGLYASDTVAGVDRVIAAHAASGRADTATLTIAARPTQGVPSECSARKPEWIWCDDFDTDRLGSYFEVDSAAGGFVRAAGVGKDGSMGMRARWTRGQVSAGALHLAIGRTPQRYFRPADAGTATYRELYWRVYFRLPPTWVGGGGDKLTRAFVFASPTTWAQAMISHVWSSGGSYLALDPARGTDDGGTLITTGYNDFANLKFLGLTRSRTPIFDAPYLGQWHCVEAHVKLNDPGMSNGLNELFINGTLEAQKTGLNWLGAFNAYGLNAVYLENYWNAGSPVAQERYLDNFVVSTSRIGC